MLGFKFLNLVKLLNINYILFLSKVMRMLLVWLDQWLDLFGLIDPWF